MAGGKNKKSKSVNKNKAKAVNETGVVGPLVEGGQGQRESTRSNIAIFFIKGFLYVVAGMIILGTIKGYSVQENKDMLLAVSGVLSGPLGFIIGYYFKSKDE